MTKAKQAAEALRKGLDRAKRQAEETFKALPAEHRAAARAAYVSGYLESVILDAVQILEGR